MGPLLWVTLLLCFQYGFGQEIIWVNGMQDLVLKEAIPIDQLVYNLSATYLGSKDGIIYGFQDRADASGNGITTRHQYFRINETSGKVFTDGNFLDYDTKEGREFQVDLIAKFRDNSKVRRRTSTITLENVNDIKPKFIYNGSLSVTIKENTVVDAAGLLMLKDIYVEDNDGILDGGLINLKARVDRCLFPKTSQVWVNCDSQFELRHMEPFTNKYFLGDFLIKDTLDYEVSGIVQVQLLATDGLNEVSTDVIVTVQDVQDMPPKWIKLDSSTEVDDQTAVRNLRVVTLAEDQDSEKRNISYFLPDGQTQYGIPVKDIFEVDQFTGIITNKVVLDLEDKTFRDYERKEIRDTWQIRVGACEIIRNNPLEIGSTKTECVDPTDVTVTINDINDNGPTFDRAVYEYFVFENEPNGRILEDPAIIITDRDTEPFSKFFSDFTTPSAEFEVTGKDRNPAISIKNSSLIDYDKGQRRYTLTLQTRDIDKTNFVKIASIIINILDMNDNRPVFDKTAYEAEVLENADEGTIIERAIKATDIDSGILGTAGIKYSLRGSYVNLFSINEDSGLVTVAKCATYGIHECLDYDEPPRVYDLTVIAKDNTGKPIGTRQNAVPLRIITLDVNDNRPVVPDYNRFIREGETEFNPELRVQATDKDEGKLSYSISASVPLPYWKIDSSTGVITVNKPNGEGIKFLEGNLEGKFNLDVKVTDGKFDVVSKVVITIIDINDNSPRFELDNYREKINETAAGGHYILTVLAKDKDDPTSDNGRIQYSIFSGNQGGRFTLHPTSGRLTVSAGAVFDYDQKKQYVMTVVATDQGTPQLSGTSKVTIDILDANNKDPVIDPFLQRYEISENAILREKVGTIAASDPDDNAILKFEFTDEKEASSDEGYVVDVNVYDYRDLFIVTEQGDILVNKQLDSRRANIVQYGVRVSDVKASPVQTGDGTVVITIKPFNTQKPVFENFTSPVIVDEQLPLGSVIISLIARDDNGIEGYKIIDQPDSYFTISSSTGAVGIFNVVDYDDERKTNGSYFIAEVRDTGEPSLTATASVSVLFRNINDNFPEFIDVNTNQPKNLYTARIPENSPDGTNVVKVYAFDRDRPDENEFNIVRYYMIDDRFDVDPLTGQIFVRLQNGSKLDREQNSRILTSVIARDNPNNNPQIAGFNNQKQRVATVQVELIDVNDNCPKFSKPEGYKVTVFETIGEDTDVLQLFSSDSDLGNFAKSIYTKVAGQGTDYLDFFNVRRESGRVYVQKSLRGHVSEYQFFVQAEDNLGNGCKTNVSVNVNVKQSGNVPPEWVIPPIDNMTIYVLEEQYNGMVIYDVKARDNDTGLNGVIDYSFIYEGENTQATPEFKINSVTGVIQAEIVYDRETQPRYVLLLKAKDRGETPLETTRFLTVLILDVNDNDPYFQDNEVEFEVTEGQGKGTYINSVEAFDKDLNDTIFYRFISGNEDGVFALDPLLGAISLAKQLDRESKSVYYLDVQATNDEPDDSVVRYRKRRALDPSIITVKILVGDINDLAPVFLQARYYGCVSTRTSFNQRILTVNAIDRDAVGTGVVRYRLMGGNHDMTNPENPKTIFAINDKFGFVTNQALMKDYADQTFVLIVNARDAVDIASAESTNTTAKIFVTQPAKEVKLQISQNTAEVRLYLEQIQSIVEKADNIDYLCVTDLQDHKVDSSGLVSTLWSDLFVSAVREVQVGGQTNYHLLSATELKNTIEIEKVNRRSDFDLLYITSVEEASSSDEVELDDKSILIILIIIAVLIFIIVLFCILAYLCIKAVKRQKKELLIHKSYATPPPAPEPVVVDPVMYDNRAFMPEPVLIQQEPVKVVTPDPVHIQYAVVQKRSVEQEYRAPTPEPVIIDEPVDDGDVIVTEIRTSSQPTTDVYQPEPEYRIETEVVDDDRL